MFPSLNKVTTSVILAAALTVGPISTASHAGQSCWGLEGQALSDCIDKLVDELADAANQNGQSDTAPTRATIGAVKPQTGGETGTTIVQRASR